MDSPTRRIEDLIRGQRDAHLTDICPDPAVRTDRLRRLERMLDAHEAAFIASIRADFGARSADELRITETMLVRSALRHARRHLAGWMRPRRAPVAPAYWPGRAMLMRQPLGVIGIISPWNYPLQLSIAPLIAALAAGNRALIKPSETAPAFAAALETAVADCFAPEEVAVVTGGADVGRAFAAARFDHLLFTGSTAVGREVALAAARNLTPVTLELGGKSPLIIDASCMIEGVADRIAWGKLINAGQTCVAPDYALVPRGAEERFAATVAAAMRRLYPHFRGNPDYTAIIDERHVSRLGALVAEARAGGARVIEVAADAVGTLGAAGAPDASRRFAPLLLLDVKDDMRIMREEIFGPILPIVPYDRPDDALAYVRARPAPLALYWFGRDRAVRDRVLATTIAGGVTINDTLIHVAQDGLPLGGVGDSGQGQYHGEFGFLRFSHVKPVFVQSRHSGLGLIRPPYAPSLSRLLRWLARLT